MTIKLELDLADVNTVIEGLSRVQENAGRVLAIVREQGTAQYNALMQAEQAAQQAAQQAADNAPTDVDVKPVAA